MSVQVHFLIELLVFLLLKSLCLYLCDQKQQSEHKSWYLEDGAAHWPPASAAVGKMLQEHVRSCLPHGWGEGWVAATVLRADTDQK